MNSIPFSGPRTSFACLAGLASLAGAALTWTGCAAPNVVLWDTRSAVAESADAASSADWKVVPRDLSTLEADPPKASSDPGYYGREYTFKGDAVVENRSIAAVFQSAAGKVACYAKSPANAAATLGQPGSPFGRKFAEFAPGSSAPGGFRITHYSVVRNAADEVVLDVAFSAQGSPDVSAVFSFGRSEIVEIKPAANMNGVRLTSPIQYGIIPGFVGDDLILGGAALEGRSSMHVPVESVFLGLLQGEDMAMVVTWPNGRQQLKIGLGAEKDGLRLLETLDFHHDGQSLYLAPLRAPGIWHREELKPTYLEKDVEAQWKRPFRAKWTTQLSEQGVPTSFAFREARGEVWRGVPGSYSYPVWFEADTARYHFGKKIPPKGESIVYFLEPQDTPLEISTPSDIIKETLGRTVSESILDVAGRRLRTHHRRGGDGVHRACTCGCTEVIQAVFEAGQETTKKDLIAGALGDMNYFVECHVERIQEYLKFADETQRSLRARMEATPDLVLYLTNLVQLVQQIPEEYEVQKENMKSASFAAELTHKTMALTTKSSTNNLPAYMELLKAWRGMGGSQDYVIAQCHTLTRKLFQQASQDCVDDPRKVEIAREVRARCRRILRNPDGYEIWPDY